MMMLTELSIGLSVRVYFLSLVNSRRPGKSPPMAVARRSRVVSATSIRELVRLEINARCGRMVVVVELGLLEPQATNVANPHNKLNKVAFCLKLGVSGTACVINA